MSIVAFDQRLHCIDESKRLPIVLELFNKIDDYSLLTSNLFFGLPFWKFYRTKKWKKFEKVSDFIFE